MKNKNKKKKNGIKCEKKKSIQKRVSDGMSLENNCDKTKPEKTKQNKTKNKNKNKTKQGTSSDFPLSNSTSHEDNCVYLHNPYGIKVDLLVPVWW